MKKDQGFFEYISGEIFADMADISWRPMFGGWGFYKNGVIFGIIADGELYFKVDEQNRADYEAVGSKPFVYSMKNGKETSLTYWQLPEDILENKRALAKWIDKAVAASLRAKADKKSKKKPTAKKNILQSHRVLWRIKTIYFDL